MENLFDGATEMFNLPGGKKSVGFWELVLKKNVERKKDGKPWLFQGVITKAKEQSGFSDVPTLVDFIDAEWGSMARYNVAKLPVDPNVQKKIKEFLESEKGIAYKLKWPASGRMD